MREREKGREEETEREETECFQILALVDFLNSLVTYVALDASNRLTLKPKYHVRYMCIVWNPRMRHKSLNRTTIRLTRSSVR